jgi:hypothetical protein
MVCGAPSALHRHAIALCVLALTACPLFGAVKLLVRDGRPIVDGVYVNGQGPYRFLLDTGANMNLMESRLAKKIGMGVTFSEVVGSSVGKTSMPGSDGNVVEFGPVRAEQQRFQYSDLDALHLLGPDIRGVLGQAFLSRFDYTLDLRTKQLEFGRQDRNGNRSQFRLQDGRSAIATNLGDLVLDSGASRLVLFGVAPGIGGQLRDMLTLAGSTSVRMISSRLAIAGRDVWRGDAVAIPAQTEAGIAGLMPLSVFNSIYICNSERYVVFD